jgi:hypothetical protein
MALRIILTVSAAALAVGACSPRFFHRHRHEPYKAVTSLTCPQSQGDLTRKSAAADGKSCDYTGPDGADVSLQLVALDGTNANDALAPVEAKLRAEVPQAAADAANGGAPGEGRVDIDLPGIHIHASGKDNDHDNSHVRIGDSVSIDGGNTVVSDNKSGEGAVNIDAHDKGAEIRVDEGHGGVRRNFILASDKPGPNGYKVGAYDARGPAEGPLVVATLLAKSDDHDQVSDDVRELIRLNVGG